MNIDKTIQELFQIIEERKAKIKKLERPNYKTNMSFSMDEENNRINLHIQPPETLLKILSWLKIQKMAFDEICVKNKFEYKFLHQSKTYEQWENDILMKINIINIKTEKAELMKDEEELKELLSPEEIRKLRVEAIAKRVKK